MHDLTDFLKRHTVIMDGSMGTLLQARGLPAGTHPAEWNLTRPEAVEAVHRAYFDVGCNVVNTNTFGISTLQYAPELLHRMVAAAVGNARNAAASSAGKQEKFVALDVGPTGKLLKPYGTFEFEDIVEAFASLIREGVAAGVDLIVIETMNDSYETKAALLAAKENSDLPVWVTNSYGADGKLMTGATPAAMVALLEGMGADAIGVNCSLGPTQLRPVVDQYLHYASVPVICKPNAGLPGLLNGKTVYDVEPEAFVREMESMAEAGVSVLGGCCGTNPEYIRLLAERLAEKQPAPILPKNRCLVSSYTHALEIGAGPLLAGERLNPTGKPRLAESLKTGQWSYVLQETVSQMEEGADLLDVNAGLPGVQEEIVLPEMVAKVQAVSDLPLQLDTSNGAALEAALRIYNGKPVINSVNGTEQSMQTVFPLVKKYGGAVIALTLDEEGIPGTVEGRLAIAQRILERAASYGIPAKELIFDALTMTVSTDPLAAVVTLKTMKAIRHDLGCHTILGVSNVSFGLPARDVVNATFLGMAYDLGLDIAIYNPSAIRRIADERAAALLRGEDPGCRAYLAAASGLSRQKQPERHHITVKDLSAAVEHGLKDKAGEYTRKELSFRDAMELVTAEIIPALNRVGEGFEKGRIFLPQLMMSAEAAGEALDLIKLSMKNAEKKNGRRMLLATVRGDIHDIGKNICRLLLESYGYDVTDLGRDVSPERILEAVTEDVALVGLSALMTTTLPAMEETIALLKAKRPGVTVCVGGAVLTAALAAEMGADRYTRDAMELVRYAGTILMNSKEA